MRRRIVIALAIALVAFAFALVIGSRQIGRGDLTLPLCGAEHMLQGTDPYACNTFAFGRYWPSNPLTTVLYVLPFLAFGDYAAPMIFALSCALLAFASTRRGEYWRLFIFLCPSFWDTFSTFQWGPLFAAIYLLPDLLPLSIIKPQVAIPLVLTKLNRHRLAGLAIFGTLTLIIDPTWILRWLPQTSAYDGYIPLFALPLGPLLLLALLNRRDERARFLLFFAMMPQRYFYDLMLLWVLPRSLREMAALTTWTYLCAMLVRLPLPLAFLQATGIHQLALLAFYLPALVLILLPVFPVRQHLTAGTGKRRVVDDQLGT